MKNTIRIQNFSLDFGTHSLFDNASCLVSPMTKNALLGHNGSGKSTLFAAVADSEKHNKTINMKGLCYFLQQHKISSYQQSVYEYLEAYCQEGMEYQIYITCDIWLKDIDSGTMLSALSGGQQQRVKLAVLNLVERDIVLMDEPTNHLDKETVDMLTQWIQETKATVWIISHDRYWINQWAENCYVIEAKKLHKYLWTYDDRVQKKQEEYERAIHEHNDREKKKKKEETLIKRIRQRASVHKSPKWWRLLRHRMKLYQKTIVNKSKEKPQSKTVASYALDGGQHQKKRIIEWSTHVWVDLGYLQLMGSAMKRSANERILISWSNGSWKTSFLHYIVDLLTQWGEKEETITIGNNIQRDYIDQHNSSLESSMTVASWFRKYRWHVHDHQVVATLLPHAIEHKHLNQPLGLLSHGQRMRLQLLQVTRKSPDLLIFDEPTNHCDIETREAIEDMLIAYQWCLICVSHDNYFIERVGFDRCFVIDDGAIRELQE